MSEMMNSEEILIYYQSHIETFNMQMLEHKKLASRYSYTRLGIFILAIPLMYFLAQYSWVALVAGLVVVTIVFIRAVMAQHHHDKTVRILETKIELCNNELRVILNDDNQYYNGQKFKVAHHFFIDDLDVFGPNSIYALFNRSKTFQGITKLATFFTEIPTKETVLERQNAVRELTKKEDWRLDFLTALYAVENGEHQDLAKSIEEELELELSFANGRVMTFFRKALPFLWILVAAVYFIHVPIANFLISLLFIFNLLLIFRKAKEVSNIQGHLSMATIKLRSYADALKCIFEENWTSPLMKNMVEDNRGNDDAVKVILELKAITDRLDYRLNLIPAIILNGMLLWDFRIISQLADWKKENKQKLGIILQFIGEVEALTSLATWAFNHPQYNYPEINDEYFYLMATGAKHPLIPEEDNVPNDFEIKKGDHLSIITGSNMSGKSTLLRTIGANMILAYSGGKVAAEYFSTPIVTVISYMRIKDILEESVSTFKAELDRIALILERLNKGEKCFLLIDEMLRGTNSKDKLTGSIGIAKRLLKEKTYAMIATHDIKLAELSNEINEGIKNYYFDIDYEDGDLIFDYKVKEGICENFNASFLLKRLGIEME